MKHITAKDLKQGGVAAFAQTIDATPEEGIIIKVGGRSKYVIITLERLQYLESLQQLQLPVN